MVHALVSLHAVLTPYGIVADLRPDRLAIPRNRTRHPQVYCVEGDHRVHAGFLTSLKPLADYRAADRAVRQVIRQGLFTLQATEAFDFHYYFDSLAHLDKALATRWTDTILEDPTRHRLSVLLRRHPRAQVMAVSRIRLRVLMKRSDGYGRVR